MQEMERRGGRCGGLGDGGSSLDDSCLGWDGGAVDVEQGLSGTIVGCRSEGECHDEDVEVWGGVKRAIRKRF